MDATPSVALPPTAGDGLPEQPPLPTRIGAADFLWGSRTYLMGIVNVTPDSFSGDGLLAVRDEPVPAAVEQGWRMAAERADVLDIGGESSRPGHQPVSEDEELGRVLPVLRALQEALPGMPLSIDTTKRRVAEAALDAGAGLLNDIWGVGPSDELARLAAERRVPLVVMHNRTEPRYRNLLAEVIADLSRALERALAAGVAWDALIVDPGIGFGKSAAQHLPLLRELPALTVLGRPILLGTSRKSTIGKVLDLPADQRLEGTLATTALGIAAGADMIRVHDVEPNRRVALMTDAIVRGWSEEREEVP